MSFIATKMIYAGALYEVPDLIQTGPEMVTAINVALGSSVWQTGAAWGGITGTLSAQTDLQAALNAKQASSADLTAIDALAGTSGYLKKTAVDTWVLDAGTATSNWGAIAGTLSSQTDLQTALNGKQPVSADLTAIDALAGTSGYLKKTAADTWALDAGLGGASWGAIAGTLSTQTDLQAALDAKQTTNASLTAFGAVATTNKFYYLSAANTWTAVTVGTGLNFTTGTLTAVIATANIDNLAITTGKIDAYAVTTAKIADGAVTTAKLANGAVTPAKMSSAVTSVASAASHTADCDVCNLYIITEQGEAATIEAPDGTPGPGQKLMFRIHDDGSAQALDWDAIFRVGSAVLPITTIVAKTLYVLCLYNETDVKWDVMSVDAVG